MVALFEVGALTTSMQVIRNDEVLYERDQAFGGAQLTQLIVRQYGFSPEEAESKKRSGDLPEDYESGVLKPLWKAWPRKSAARSSSFYQHPAQQG
jgi:type IV pilus assembly protein PilM